MKCDVCGAPGVHPGRGRCGGADAIACELRATAEELRHDVRELRAERDALKAQVEAARKRCRDRLDYGEGDADLAQDILDAMDEAAK